MSQFEYITVLTSFVVAVGVSQILSGWGRAYLSRETTPLYPLQLAASVLLLVALLQSIWGYWGFRDVSWDFSRFVILLAPLLPLVGATYLVMQPPSLVPGPMASRDHYFSVHRMVFLLLAAWVALGTVAEVALIESDMHLGQAIRLLGIALMVLLAFSRRPRVHWLGVAALAALQFFFIRVVTPTLD